MKDPFELVEEAEWRRAHMILESDRRANPGAQGLSDAAARRFRQHCPTMCALANSPEGKRSIERYRALLRARAEWAALPLRVDLSRVPISDLGRLFALSASDGLPIESFGALDVFADSLDPESPALAQAIAAQIRPGACIAATMH